MDKIVDVNLKPEDVLAALRWHDDMKVVNDFGEHVWLKLVSIMPNYSRKKTGH